MSIWAGGGAPVGGTFFFSEKLSLSFHTRIVSLVFLVRTHTIRFTNSRYFSIVMQISSFSCSLTFLFTGVTVLVTFLLRYRLFLVILLPYQDFLAVSRFSSLIHHF